MCIGLVVHDPCRRPRGARHHNGNWSRQASRSITATTPCARFTLHALANVLPLSSRWRCGCVVDVRLGSGVISILFLVGAVALASWS